MDYLSGERFGIGMYQARATLKVTDQGRTSSSIPPLTRRYKPDQYCSDNNIGGNFANNTLFADIRSISNKIEVHI